MNDDLKQWGTAERRYLGREKKGDQRSLSVRDCSFHVVFVAGVSFEPLLTYHRELVGGRRGPGVTGVILSRSKRP